MLTLSELKRIAAREGVPQAIVEKDYALSVALNEVSKSESSTRLVFKGGTAIKKVYFGDARFSEDLDFTVLRLSKEDVISLLKDVISDKTFGGIRFFPIEAEQTTAGLKASVKFSGPMGHQQRIRFDFSFRENIVGHPVRKPLIDSFGLGDYEVSVLALDEIFAEKIHALGSRSAPRDLYDVWFLLNRGVTPNVQLIGKKFAYYGEKIDRIKLEANIEKAAKEWKRDLGPLVKNLPDFKTLTNAVKNGIQQLWES